jgi:hypothetical protein
MCGATHRASFKLGRTQQIPDFVCQAHHMVASGLLQFHNHDRQLVSLYSIQNVIQLERAPNRGSFKLGSKNAAKVQQKCSEKS